MGGFTYYAVNKLLFYLKIDDPVDAIPIHAVMKSIFYLRDVVYLEHQCQDGLTETMGYFTIEVLASGEYNC